MPAQTSDQPVTSPFTTVKSSFTGGGNTPPSSPVTNPAEDIALDTLDQVLTDVEFQQAQVAQAVAQPVAPAAPVMPVAPTAPDPAPQVAQPQPAVRTGPAAKESLAIAPQEMVSAGAAGVEYERSPEIPPEVESYMEKVGSDPHQMPHEVVISGQDIAITPPKTMTQPVIVLPITPEEEAVGEKKNPSFSIRWLVEWSRKIMRMFSGKVIYRQE